MTETGSPELWRDARLGTAHEVRLPKGAIRYHEAGEGPVLVFVHGYLVNANIWRKLVPLLADRFRCITPDWPLGSHIVPMPRGADLTPPGIAGLIGDLLDVLDLCDVTLIGNDSGGAYSQIAAAERPRRLGRLVLNSCETPWCSWPPGPGGFGLLKAAAGTPLTHHGLYQILRLPSSWRWRNTYGRLAKYPIDRQVMHGYVRPVLTRAAIRFDGRKAIGGVSNDFSRRAAEVLQRRFTKPVLCAWAAEDRVFPLDHGLRYAGKLGTELRTIADSYTYTAEDQPERTAEVLRDWLLRVG
ncbi:Pimeloyl-ACP methyl ester carboxylesterase [Amycolatopsis marina]|uniref:Pimeloyl-ACP methyl ester carboxylesterase n=1 Tax=Amycolatopsis marina TaxID=490629 RepID=A0A1I1B075_9PSEU|nr:alpha/beta hydrolase [Amycolatopsis marina]SFB43497.1 Pimeloyl-ACP methyl ester carboxylesterase [Amycolatopsis marina]